MTIEVEQHPLIGRRVRIVWGDRSLMSPKDQVHVIHQVRCIAGQSPLVTLTGFQWEMRLDGTDLWTGERDHGFVHSIELVEEVSDDAQ